MKQITLGLSGGVDSAVSAFLLKKQGYKVKAIHIKSWDAFLNNDEEGTNEDCEQGRDYQDAKSVADFLGIELISIDMVGQYWEKVFAPALEAFKKGETPNPDNFCNRFIKFGIAKDLIEERIGKTLYATGHYAKVRNHNGTIEICQSKDKRKDQTYFLSRVENKNFSNVVFPLGDLTKEEVRKIAKENNLPVADKKDSTGLCFIGERRFEEFLKNYIPTKVGDIIDYETKKIIGKHNGHYFYTIGQSKGLNLGGQKVKKVVYKKNIKDNIIYVVSKGSIVSKRDFFWVSFINLIGSSEDELMGEDISVKVRYRSKSIKCKVIKKDESYKVILDTALEAITAGQEAVFYKNNKCLGGGTIHLYK